MKNYSKIIKIASKNSTIRKGIVISLTVGTLLNLINQGNLILSTQFPEVSVIKIFLTYITPFMVSVYSTTTALLNTEYAEINQQKN
jgi:hypothetical protein